MAINEMEIMELAYIKFEKEKYDEALELFVQVYNSGFEQDKIYRMLYDCYISGNEQTFRDTYEACNIQQEISYDRCILEFFPYREGEYYIYDKSRKKFEHIFDIKELYDAENKNNALKVMEFTPITLEFDGNLNMVLSVFAAAKKREIYMICDNAEKVLSYCKLPELREYMKHVHIFRNRETYREYFHKHTEKYLPRMVFAEEEASCQISDILEKEHLYRLTSEGRNNSNVLLTIGIPTYHRGNLLLKRIENLIKMPYDAEIEIVISKNGTGIYQEEYDKIEQIDDARIVYVDHDKDLRPVLNWHYTVELAHGKYVLFVSDEDDVILKALEHYLAILYNDMDTSLVRARTSFQYSPYTESQYGKKGLEAFKKTFLFQSYLSGLIVRRKDFLDADLLKLEKYLNNAFYQIYPHEWWTYLLNTTGDYRYDSCTLILEGESVLQKEVGDRSDKNVFVPVYATYEARINQLKGMLDFLRIFANDDFSKLYFGTIRVIGKIANLFEVAHDRKYDLEHYEQRVGEFAEICLDVIMQFPLQDKLKKGLLLVLQEIVSNLLQNHRDFLVTENNSEH